MLKRLAAVMLIVLSLSLQGCVSVAAGLSNYASSTSGYQFLYPNGWVQVKVSDGPDVVFHDLIEMTENLSVVINPVPEGKTLQDLGGPSEVGYRLSKNAIAPPGSGREAELISVASREVNGVTYYLLEYAVKLANQQERHNLASVAVRRGQLYTLNLSASASRWAKKQSVFRAAVESFSVY